MIKLIAADNAEGRSLSCADFKSLACEIEMGGLGIHMRDFAHIEIEAFEDDLRVDDEPACAQLEAWIMLLFEDQDLVSQMRSDPCQMQCSGESAWSAAEDDDLGLHPLILPQKTEHSKMQFFIFCLPF